MKKVFLFLSVLLALQQTKAQNMPIPSPNAGNVLFLKFSFSLNSSRGYFIDDFSISPQGNRDFKPVYPYLGHNVSDASGSMMMNFFYVPNPDEKDFFEKYKKMPLPKSRNEMNWVLFMNLLYDFNQYGPAGYNFPATYDANSWQWAIMFELFNY